MGDDLIRYDVLVQDALRGVMRQVLAETAKVGLQGNHHFYVTFVTNAPGVRISSQLLEQYAEEMTIVLQLQFWDLKVNDHQMEVNLSFNGVSEKLVIPYSAIISFVDPSVNFGFQFEPVVAGDGEFIVDNFIDDEALFEDNKADNQQTSKITDNHPAAQSSSYNKEDNTSSTTDDETEDADVISLDAFRKK